ncbi:hypothetical protein [Streptomyces sp. NA13]|uniref:hypothetical protein n=1 Tax=Streptomyces sp. NA13 TaxID=2996051 RepID=UPI00226F050E|nr:hypothetical protein [Streptomyces sp. NA13]WAC95727.1 hypothetical protein OSU72_06065 [Streptomyces sp. NA13]
MNRILIVEDEERIASFIVVGAPSSRAAVSRTASHPGSTIAGAVNQPRAGPAERLSR